jgi:hypothetical protein
VSLTLFRYLIRLSGNTRIRRMVADFGSNFGSPVSSLLLTDGSSWRSKDATPNRRAERANTRASRQGSRLITAYPGFVGDAINISLRAQGRTYSVSLHSTFMRRKSSRAFAPADSASRISGFDQLGLPEIPARYRPVSANRKTIKNASRSSVVMEYAALRAVPRHVPAVAFSLPPSIRGDFGIKGALAGKQHQPGFHPLRQPKRNQPPRTGVADVSPLFCSSRSGFGRFESNPL